ncbi:MAG: SRPBCC family protein [Acidobacteriota bacterium]
MSRTEITVHLRAPRERVYRAFVDPGDVQQWMVPPSMRSEVHAWDARAGGAFRVTLTYAGEGAGKTTARSDTYHGRFVELVPPSRIVEALEFETADPAMQGEMTMTIELREVAGGTEVVAVHEHLPQGVAPADNELGWRQSLAQLAALVEPA